MTGGITAPVDVHSGRIRGGGVDKSGRVYFEHPDTGHMIDDFPIPLWEDVKTMVEAVARVLPEAGYVGWDIGITPGGPVCIEGNTDPGYVSLQRPAFAADGGGVRHLFQPFL